MPTSHDDTTLLAACDAGPWYEVGRWTCGTPTFAEGLSHLGDVWRARLHPATRNPRCCRIDFARVVQGGAVLLASAQVPRTQFVHLGQRPHSGERFRESYLAFVKRYRGRRYPRIERLDGRLRFSPHAGVDVILPDRAGCSAESFRSGVDVQTLRLLHVACVNASAQDLITRYRLSPSEIFGG